MFRGEINPAHKHPISIITSDAVAPGQQSEPQHGVAEPQHHAEHVQQTDHLGRRGADQHGAHHEAQESEQLEGEDTLKIIWS